MPIERRSEDLVVARLTDGAPLRSELNELQKLNPPADVVFDFTQVAYLESAHLGQLLTIRRHLHAHDKRLRLFGMQPAVRQLFQITSLELIMDIFDAEDAAVASLR